MRIFIFLVFAISVLTISCSDNQIKYTEIYLNHEFTFKDQDFYSNKLSNYELLNIAVHNPLLSSKLTKTNIYPPTLMKLINSSVDINEERYDLAIKRLISIKADPAISDPIIKKIIDFEKNYNLIYSYLEKFNLDKAFEILTKTENTLKEESTLNIILTTRLTILESKFYFLSGKYQRSVCALNYGLHNLRKVAPYNNQLQNRLELTKANYLINESNNHQIVAKSILQKILVKNSVASPTLKLKAQLDQITLLAEMGSKESDFQLENFVDLFDSVSTSQKAHLLNTYLFKIKKDPNPKSAKHVLKKIESFNFPFNKNCAKTGYIHQLYMSSLYLKIGDHKKSNDILQGISVPEICDTSLINLISFYKNSNYIDIIKASPLRSGDLDKLVLLLFQNRELAKQLFKGSYETHLGDYYADNFEELLNVFNKNFNGKVPSRFNKFFINELEYTRIKIQKNNLQAVSNKSIINNKGSLNQIIRKGLAKTNDLVDFDPTDQVNTDLYLAYKELHKLEKEKSIEICTDSVNNNIGRIINTLSIEKESLLATLCTDSLIWFIYFDGKETSLSKFEKGFLKAKILELRKEIKNREQVDLSEFTFLNKYNTQSNKLYVVPDEVISQIPLDLIFKNYELKSNLNQIYYNLKKVLNHEKSTLFSFSDSITRKSLIKQNVSELYNDYEECKTITNTLGSKSVLLHGKNATLDELFSINDLDILHISSHAKGNRSNRFTSYFYLRNDKGEPTKIYTHQLYEIKQPPTFVCLSVCESGIGKGEKGQGVYSLARPFLTNGTLTVLKTLWKIDDQSSKELIINFYKYWDSGLSVSESLTKAKEDFKLHPKYSHPYYWAGFILEGNPNLYLK